MFTFGETLAIRIAGLRVVGSLEHAGAGQRGAGQLRGQVVGRSQSDGSFADPAPLIRPGAGPKARGA